MIDATLHEAETVWRAPAPLWRELGTSAAGFTAPTILRFAGDDFVDQLRATLDGAGSLAGLVVGPETWRDPGAGLSRGAADEPCTLFQPTHDRFYLVTASLVCRRYGHPDRATAPGDDTLSFLLRRLVPSVPGGRVDVADPTTSTELARHGGRWVVASATGADPAEERLPLFPTAARGADGRGRRIWTGLVPVAGDAARSAPPRLDPDELADATDPAAALADPRAALLQPLVVGLQQLVVGPQPGTDEDRDTLRESVYWTLVDLAGWLDAPWGPARTPGSDLGVLLDRDFDTGRGTSWREALAEAGASEADAVFGDGPEPSPIATMTVPELRDAVERLGIDTGRPTATTLFATAVASLPEGGARPEVPGAPPADESGVEGETATSDGVYVVRFLRERPSCPPRARQQLSDPTRPFRLAAFHDPDAPARPVRIPMPVDTSPGGLRRFPKNVSVVLSNELRRQMDRVGPDTLRDGDLGDGAGLDLGMICTLSIPIITICALLLLMIIVRLLNIVFFWLPLFRVCIPAPRVGGS